MIENERLEYKKSLGELKEALISIAAMLNKHGGGEVWFGLKNNGTPVDLDVTDKTLRDLSQAIAAHIEPKVYPTISTELVGGKHCVKVAFVGEDAPYYALRWDNKFSDAALADLDEGKVQKYVATAGLPWDTLPNALEKLGVLRIGMRLDGLYRVDVPEISTAAMREAVINAFCHRDYRDPDEVRVAIFKDRVEIRNPGSLFGGLTTDDLRKGNISKRRNPLIAELLRRIHMVEGWGRGMPLILEEEPTVRFRETAQIFITDFIRHATEEEGTTTINDKTTTITTTITNTIPLSDKERAIIGIFREQPAITLHEAATRLDMTKDGIRYYIKKNESQKNLAAEWHKKWILGDRYYKHPKPTTTENTREIMKIFTLKSFLSRNVRNIIDNQNIVKYWRISFLSEIFLLCANYTEEGRQLFLEIFLLDDVEKFLTFIPDSSYVMIGSAKLNEHGAKYAVKRCAPLIRGCWRMYFTKGDKPGECIFGIFRDAGNRLHTPLEIAIKGIDPDYASYIFVSYHSYNSIKVTKNMGHESVINFSNNHHKLINTHNIDDLIDSICTDVSKDNKEACCRYLKNSLPRAFRDAHGVLLAVIEGENLPSCLKDGIKLSLSDSLSSIIATASSRKNDDSIRALEELIFGVLQCDGIVAFNTKSKLIAYNVFINSTKSSVTGGARRRAFDSLCLCDDAALKAVYYQSQDGINEFWRA